MDVVKRLESIIIEVERENESICIIGHQAILRCLYAYFMKVPRVEVRLASTFNSILHALYTRFPTVLISYIS
jgi:6-phosphofructo-2-kinase / fructose-2,6-biphosphatase 3